jgi:hypothetical protein
MARSLAAIAQSRKREGEEAGRFAPTDIELSKIGSKTVNKESRNFHTARLTAPQAKNKGV